MDLVMYNQICKLKSYDAIANVLNGITLDERQCVDLLKAICVESICISYDTGMGKTLLASAWMKLLRNEARGRKFIMFIKNNQLAQTPRKVEKCSGLKVYATSGQTEDYNKIFNSNKFLRCDVLMMTHNTLNDSRFMLALLTHRDKFAGIVVDEMHNVCNFTNSQSAYMLKNILAYYKYNLGLTATPITVSTDQLAKIIHMLKPKEVPEYKELIRYFNEGNVPIDIARYIIVRERDMNLNKPILRLVEPLAHQKDCSEALFSKVTKGYGADNAFAELLETINSYKREGKKGLVYVNLFEVYDYVTSSLEGTGIRYAVINGKINKDVADRNKVIADFDNGEYDVILTNIKEAIDLNCDYVCFYELTVHARQMMGRALRGLDPRPIDIIYILVNRTRDIDFFINNIYTVAIEIKGLIGQSCNEIEGIYGAIYDAKED